MTATTSDIVTAFQGYVGDIGDLIFDLVPTLMLSSIVLFGLFFGIKYGMRWLKKAISGKV